MIHILWPTLRVNVFMRIHKTWMERSSKKNIKTYVAVESQHDFDVLRQYSSEIEIKIANSPQIGVCYPSYILSSDLKGDNNDIVILASDDFIPPEKWDEYLIEKLNNKSGILMVRDGYQLPDSSNMLYPAITIPIMTYDCLLKLNRNIYNPIYSHMFSDVELYFNAKDLNLLIDNRLTDTTTFEHCHYAAGKRNADQNDVNYNKSWNKDSDTWNKRKNMPIEERLKV